MEPSHAPNNRQSDLNWQVCNNECYYVLRRKMVWIQIVWCGRKMTSFEKPQIVSHICLRKNKNQCRAITVCMQECQYEHHFLLQNDQKHTPPKSNSTANTTTTSSNLHATSNVFTMLHIVPVILYNGTNRLRSHFLMKERQSPWWKTDWAARQNKSVSFGRKIYTSMRESNFWYRRIQQTLRDKSSSHSWWIT